MSGADRKTHMPTPAPQVDWRDLLADAMQAGPSAFAAFEALLDRMEKRP